MSAVKEKVIPMRLYLGGKMRGEPEFGFSLFDEAATELRSLDFVKSVFNPAENDRKNGFDTTGMRGTDEEMAGMGFSARKALQQDFAWISRWSEGMIVLGNWLESDGAFAEAVFHQANHLPVWTLGQFMLSQGDPGVLKRSALPNIRTIAGLLGISLDNAAPE